ncbi:sensor histidine kinase [Nonomuraea turcica]|uniref:sensor histidine kinase n=1 Tax=Nonomuraea sp. G32 TaxID=3067274 RepID=UPI00273C222F|nr:HAMP domain-containing sensor histidine kinase [Nonomuraea sp. G32]MDP4509660.1 HAMP domain-containing sensor histidine kinase [Nonomuraea sp. G32]
MTWSLKSSIRARYALAMGVFSLIVLSALGATLDLAIRAKVQMMVFNEAERVASQWSAAARTGVVPHRIPASGHVELIQVVDAHQRVVESSKMASDTLPLSRVRPPPDDRFQRYIECPWGGHCLMLMAIRLSPAPDAGVVYAGLPEPDVLSTHRLEYVIGTGIALLVAVAAWTTWLLVGRTLRPVEAIRARISEITVSDLSLRVPVPPGRDEIAQLAVTANQTLAHLEGAVEQQRRFASTTSHELRNPITGLRAQLEEAARYPDDVDPHETIRTALSATDRLEAIVDDLLQLARLRAAEPTPPEHIDLGELVATEVNVKTGRVPADIRAPRGLVIRGHRMQLIRVLDNLLANAQRHAESAVGVTVEQDEDEAVVAVTDDGPGVAPADRERIFERFVRLDDSRSRDPGGSGLGLAISRDIARAHNGSLEVEDSPRGARFALRLPLVDRVHSPSGDAYTNSFEHDDVGGNGQLVDR